MTRHTLVTHAAGSLEEKLAELTAAFAASMPQRIETIETAWTAFESAPDAPDTIEPRYRAVHNLAGSYATYGFDETGERARTLCDELDDIRENKTVLAAPDFKGIAALVASLRESAWPGAA